MENICLVTPPSPFLLDERVFMHIGILKVASSLESARKNSGTGTLNFLHSFAAKLREISICMALPTGLKMGFFSISSAQDFSAHAMDMGTIRSG